MSLCSAHGLCCSALRPLIRSAQPNWSLCSIEFDALAADLLVHRSGGHSGSAGQFDSNTSDFRPTNLVAEAVLLIWILDRVMLVWPPCSSKLTTLVALLG
ncbi:hypothetical protein U1Q18_027109 [Sarracenia purpurea var. burkii]